MTPAPPPGIEIHPPSPDAPVPRMPALATAAILLGLAGCCLGPVAPFGAALSVYALWRYRRDAPKSGRLFATLGLGIAVTDLLVWVLLLWPHLKHLPERLVQQECVHALASLSTKESEALKKTGALVADPTALGWHPPSSRYRYHFAPSAELPPLAGGVVPGSVGPCPDCAFTAACVGQADDDAALDVWSVSTRARTGPGGQSIPANEPFNDVDDAGL